MMPLTLPTLGSFADPAAFAIVGGGTLVALVLRTPARDLVRGLAALRVLWRGPFRADALLTQIDAFARISARHGVVQLDRSVIADPDVAAAIGGIVDGAGGEEVSALLGQRRASRAERHRTAIELWSAAAEIFPAMGMVGTLVGLVRMFAGMTDPATIGGSMAVAVLATLYGALAANVVAMPIAARLKRLARAELVERARLVPPLTALAERERPRLKRDAA